MTSPTLIELLGSLSTARASFIEPMECLPVAQLPNGAPWVYEIKLDGYRAIAMRDERGVFLFSRRGNSFNRQYPAICEALADLPENTVVDGEVVALDDAGQPNFHFLQHFRAEAGRIHFFVFDLLVHKNRSLLQLPFEQRRELMNTVLEFSSPRVRLAQHFVVSAHEMMQAARGQGLEGVVAKRKDSLYAPGQRTGAWLKYRFHCGQELVIGGYTPGPHGLDAIIVGYYRDKDLMYVARVRNGFVPASRRQVFEKLRPLVIADCPFVNLPEEGRSRWGEGLTAEDMKQCVWVRPELVAQIEFLEWTESDHLRHAKFAGLRDDKDPRTVIKEGVR